MTDYTKMRVEDIKQQLIDDCVFTEEQLDKMNLKGKAQWVELHKLAYAESVSTPDENEQEKYGFEELEEQRSRILEKKEEDLTPKYNDPGWHDYVMSKFAPNELIEVGGKKYPNINGLRRVAGLLLGEIVEAGPWEVKTTMDPTNSGKAVITYRIVIEWKLGGMSYDANGEAVYAIRTFSAVGSSYEGNTDDTYAVFPEAIAETRAEGRALRRALRLGVVCADELTRKDTAEVIRQQREKQEKSTDGSWEESAAITDNQVNGIKILCDRLGIDIQKFINSGTKQYGDILEVSKQTAANMIQRLNKYQNTNNEVSIPVEILKEK